MNERSFSLGRRVGLATTAALAVLAALSPVSGDPAAAITKKVVTSQDGLARLDVYLPKVALPATPRPVVVVVPGWNCLVADYEEVTAALAARGFAVAVFERDENMDLSAAKWERSLSDVVARLVKKSTTGGDALFREVDGARISILGHSLGGAVAVLAAARDPRYRAVALFGPEARDHEFLSEASKVKAASIAIDGSLDRIAPPAERSGAILAKSASRFTAQLIVKDGNHPNCPADFNTDTIRDSGRWVLKPSPIWPFTTWVYDFPIVPGVKPMPGPAQRKIAFPYLVAWLERFGARRNDASGRTTGVIAAQELAQGTLTKATFSPDARANGLAP